MKTNLGKDCYFSILGIIELDLLLSNIIKEDSLNMHIRCHHFIFLPQKCQQSISGLKTWGISDSKNYAAIAF